MAVGCLEVLSFNKSSDYDAGGYRRAYDAVHMKGIETKHLLNTIPANGF